MLPVYRWYLYGLGALWSCVAWAQVATPQPEVDESKIPEWVKRQARSPYRVIINSTTAKARPVASKDDGGNRATAKKTPVKAVAAAPETDKAEPLAANATADSAPASADTASPLSAPADAVATAAASPLQQPASASVEAATAVPVAAPATVLAPAAPVEPPPLTLLKRTEPLLPPNLLGTRLNSAKVVVVFTVTASGEVSNLSIASTTDSRLNPAVLRALQAWRYAPIPEPREHRVSFAFATE